MGVALSITVFLVLARILADLKLLKTDLGLMAGEHRALTLLSTSMTGPSTMPPLRDRFASCPSQRLPRARAAVTWPIPCLTVCTTRAHCCQVPTPVHRCEGREHANNTMTLHHREGEGPVGHRSRELRHFVVVVRWRNS